MLDCTLNKVWMLRHCCLSVCLSVLSQLIIIILRRLISSADNQFFVRQNHAPAPPLDDLSKYDPVVPPARRDEIDVPCMLLLVLFYLLPAYRLPCGTALLVILSVRFGRAPPVVTREPPQYEQISDSDDDEGDNEEERVIEREG